MAKCKLFDSFTWTLPLPAPFNDPSVEKTRTDSCSQYNTATRGKKATLHGPTLRALIQYAKLVNAAETQSSSTNLGALGWQNEQYICAEYPGSDYRAAVVYMTKKRKFVAVVINDSTAQQSPYAIEETKKSGSALLFVLMPLFSGDQEFDDAFHEFRVLENVNFSSLEEASKLAALLCDNIYRRVENAANLGTAGVPTTIPATGSITLLGEQTLKDGIYNPNSTLYGEFKIFTLGAAPAAKVSITPHTDFVGKYLLPHRVLSPAEQALVPTLEPWYVIPPDVIRFCEHIVKTTQSNSPVRNLMFRGPSATGKTESARAIAAGLGLPYYFFTCSANTEISDLLGQFLPDTGSAAASQAKLPSAEEIALDPVTAYYQITGELVEDITESGVQEKVKEILAAREEKPANQRERFVFVESPLVKAVRGGAILELQEPTVIANPGVLVGLNSLMDRTNSIRLPNGELIARHPDTVIIVTTNCGYEGTRNMNQSIISRMDLICDYDELDKQTVVERVMGATGCTDKKMVTKMAETMLDIQELCKNTCITDGSCDIRALINWVNSAMITNDPYCSALWTIVSSATSDPENRAEVISTCLEPKFQKVS